MICIFQSLATPAFAGALLRKPRSCMGRLYAAKEGRADRCFDNAAKPSAEKWKDERQLLFDEHRLLYRGEASGFSQLWALDVFERYVQRQQLLLVLNR